MKKQLGKTGIKKTFKIFFIIKYELLIFFCKDMPAHKTTNIIMLRASFPK